MGKSSPDPPPAPDYVGAAEASGESAKEVAAAQTFANRPDQTTPWGSTSWTPYKTIDPGTGASVTAWSQDMTLDPQIQSALEAEIGQQQYRSELAQSLLGRLDEAYQEYPSFDEFGNIGDMRTSAEDAMYSSLVSRLDPQWDQDQQALDIQLRNQGLQPGTEAYDNAMESFMRSRTDAYNQASFNSIAAGRDETQLSALLRQQEISEYLLERGVPLNEINALMTGQQVAQPSMPGFTAASRAAPTDYLGATSGQYQSALDAFNIGQAGQQGLQTGLFNLGNTAIGAFL